MTQGIRTWSCRDYGNIGIIALISFLIVYPMYTTGNWFVSDEGVRYPYLVEQFRNLLAQGIWYPRWIVQLNGGYGYGTFVFYQPAYFYLCMPFIALLGNVVDASYWGLISMIFIGASGAYRLARNYCNPAASFLATLLFYTSPYLAWNLFARGDLSELLAIMFTPWAAYFFIVTADETHARKLRLRNAIGLIASVALIVTSHPMVSLYYIPIICILIVGKWCEHRFDHKIVVVLALCSALALTLSAPYWFTVMQLKELVVYRDAPIFAPEAGIWATLMDTHGITTPGFYHAALALLGFIAFRRKVFFLFICYCYVIAFLLETSHFAWLWQIESMLRWTMYPWRVLSAVALMQHLGIIALFAAASVYIVKKFPRRRTQALIWLIAIIILPMLTIYNYTFWPKFQMSLKVHYNYRPWINYEQGVKEALDYQYFSAAPYNEFAPKTSQYDGLRGRVYAPIPLVELGAPDVSSLKMLSAPDDSVIEFDYTWLSQPPAPAPVITSSKNKLVAPAPAPTPAPQVTQALINQFFLPGWKVRVNGHDVDFWERVDTAPKPPKTVLWGMSKNGRIGINFPRPGTYRVQAWYDGPPGWQIRNILMLIMLTILGWALRREYRIMRKDKVSEASQDNQVAV